MALRQYRILNKKEVVKRIEKDFNVTIPKKNLYSIWIDDGDWIRFRRIFFKENI